MQSTGTSTSLLKIKELQIYETISKGIKSDKFLNFLIY